ncbi:MAG: hypothetical protein CMF77_00255 [Candidatus Marinimicrobia bacterium]|jgi:propionyl-CoA synthetase|nr:hypothetical protein [Candidatus Neomarinimicrobiota bacterium]
MKYLDEFKESIESPETFWGEQAKKIVWFEGGSLNTSYLALDYHVANGRGHQPALIYESPSLRFSETPLSEGFLV